MRLTVYCVIYADEATIVSCLATVEEFSRILYHRLNKHKTGKYERFNGHLLMENVEKSKNLSFSLCSAL